MFYVGLLAIFVSTNVVQENKKFFFHYYYFMEHNLCMGQLGGKIVKRDNVLYVDMNLNVTSNSDKSIITAVKSLLQFNTHFTHPLQQIGFM